ncbi:MAG: hypothetical protein K8F51_03090, partial [Comamonas sp.]|nr:hypothetical protein [Comamonas sp.]
SATVVRSASRSTVTICSSVNRLFLMGSSADGSHLPRNHWTGKTGQVKASLCQVFDHLDWTQQGQSGILVDVHLVGPS